VLRLGKQKHPNSILRVQQQGELSLHDNIDDVGIVTPFPYPLFKQCDPPWKDIPIGTSNTKTICDVGCLISSVSMSLNGKGVLIDNQPSNPEVLNRWLTANGGYVDSDDLEEKVVPKINPSKIKWVGEMRNQTAFSPDQIKAALNTKNTIVILNVMKGAHFVLAIGYDDTETNFYVNDPGFDKAYYLYSDIVGYRIFEYI